MCIRDRLWVHSSSILFISPIGLPPIHVLERFSQFLPYMAVTPLECLRFRLRSDYSPEMQSAYAVEQQQYCLRYVQNTSCHLFPLCGSSDVLPEHLPDWSSFLPQSISSDAETMPRHHRISLSDLPDHRNNTPGYEPEYPCLLYTSSAPATNDLNSLPFLSGPPVKMTALISSFASISLKHTFNSSRVSLFNAFNAAGLEIANTAIQSATSRVKFLNSLIV